MEWARPSSLPTSPRQGMSANLSTVAITKDGSSLYICSSTKSTGSPFSPWPAENSHRKSTHPTMTSSGLLRFGLSSKLLLLKGVWHHGHSVSGKGDAVVIAVLFL